MNSSKKAKYFLVARLYITWSISKLNKHFKIHVHPVKI